MSQNEKNVGPDLTGIKSQPDQGGVTPPAQPAQNAPESVNPGTPNVPPVAAGASPAPSAAPTGSPAPATAPAPAKTEEKALAPTGYVPGGLNRDILKAVPNPSQTDQNFPFAAGHKMHEVAQTQNFFTFPLDTYYNVFDAIYYFAEEKNRNRYTYEQQQNIISRIVRAAQDFGIPIEGIRDKLKN